MEKIKVNRKVIVLNEDKRMVLNHLSMWGSCSFDLGGFGAPRWMATAVKSLMKKNSVTQEGMNFGLTQKGEEITKNE